MIIAVIVSPPELRFTKNGKAVLTMTIRSNRLDSGNDVHAVAWEQVAELIANDEGYFKPDAVIKVSGYFKNRSYRGRNGSQVTVREFIIQEVY